jgi:hypothetical protein
VVEIVVVDSDVVDTDLEGKPWRKERREVSRERM